MASCSQCGASLDEAAKFCGSCGAGQLASSQSAGMKQNIVSVLCYAGMIIGLFGLVVPVIFLMKSRYKKIPFIRFHAIQSIIVNVILSVISLVVKLSESGEWFPTETKTTWVFIIILLCSVFLMAKAYMNEMFKIPGIGDVAAKLADQGRVD